MRSVRISMKTARAILSAGSIAWRDPAARQAIQELERAMKPKRSVSSNRKRRETKRVTKALDYTELARALAGRSGGRCELNPGEHVATEVHHALGRKVPQSEANCIAICRECHECITLNTAPHYWLNAQARLFVRLGYPETARALRLKLAKHQYKTKQAALRVSP